MSNCQWALTARSNHMGRYSCILNRETTAYDVVEWATKKVVASYPFKRERDRSNAFLKAKWDAEDRNDVQPEGTIHTYARSDVTCAKSNCTWPECYCGPVPKERS